ncbi:MAG: EamA family transporter [Gammaproteobacteria bacterium]|nr:EamA family transporter [Gammaproteobacteria bacterium]MBU1645757.1 EamA family transporter [Gammaproteobacteria bacterium]MBU1971265.1 EamA family transporter [Gammaproteobacteria bacterium]
MTSPRALAALFLLTLIWGYAWVVLKQALDYAGPFQLSALRSSAGAAALLAALLLTGRSLRIVAVGRTAWVGLFQTGAFMALQTWALVEGGPGRTSVLIFTMPIWTLLLGALLLGERVRGLQWGAVVSTVVGLVLIIEPWSLGGSLISKMLGLLAALAWAIGTVLVKRWRSHLAADVLALTAWQMVFGAALQIVVAGVVPERAVDWQPAFLFILAFMALVVTALGWFLWLYVLEHLPAWQASLSVLGVPVVAIVSSRWVLGEQSTPIELAGMLLIGSGLGLLSFLNWRAQRRLPPPQSST